MKLENFHSAWILSVGDDKMREPNDWREKGVDVQVLDETLVDGGNELIVAILET